MMRPVVLGGVVVLMLAIFVPCVVGAPALLVTKPPVASGVSASTGPVVDPNSVQGQWFHDRIPPTPGCVVNPGPYVLPYEFHDNVYQEGGSSLNSIVGGFGSYKAIYGKVTDITYNGQNITAFKITARISNDTPWGVGPWYRGENSHGEWTTMPPTDPVDPNDPIHHPYVDTRTPYVGDMHNVALTAEFALDSVSLVPSSWSLPYRQGAMPQIIAQNEDTRAWYCYTATGDYYVPTWDFGCIPVGQFAQREMLFSVDAGGLDSLDPRFTGLVASYNAGWGEGDVFFNRTTDLKIGDWVDSIGAIDVGVPYPEDPLRGGNVSVFFVPEPSTFGLLCLAAAALLARVWRRRV